MKVSTLFIAYQCGYLSQSDASSLIATPNNEPSRSEQPKLTDQHSKLEEQGENLQQHQRLLREVEEEKERNLGRMRDLEMSCSEERLLERIRVLEDVLKEKDQALTQQSANLSLVNEELEKERASSSQVLNEIEKRIKKWSIDLQQIPQYP